MAVSVAFTVSYIYIYMYIYKYMWSEDFRSWSEAKLAANAWSPKLRQFQSSTRSFMFTCHVKT